VLVTTSDGRVMARGGDPDALIATLTSSCFDESGRFRTEQEPAGAHAHGALDGMHVVVPIVAGYINHGRIVAFSGDREFDDADVHTLERAATVAALAITKQQELAAVENKYRGDFLRDLLAGRVDGSLRAVAHCASLGWDINRPLVVVVAEMDDGEATQVRSDLRPVQQRFATAWQAVVRFRDPKAPVMGFHREVVALVPMPPQRDVDRLVRDIVKDVAGDGGGGRRPFATGVSRVAATPADIPVAYSQARSAMRVARQRHGLGGVARFDDLGVFRLLSLITDEAELRDFAEQTLGDLVKDEPEMADLRRTLEVLLKTNLNIAEAARKLHFHYSTLRYRITKLERLLGPVTEDADLRLDLAVALKVIQMRSL
ncbi:MAG: PucR family transcriptional regulator, partial [Dehalococcoidia bacterium]